MLVMVCWQCTATRGRRPSRWWWNQLGWFQASLARFRRNITKCNDWEPYSAFLLHMSGLAHRCQVVPRVMMTDKCEFIIVSWYPTGSSTRTLGAQHYAATDAATRSYKSPRCPCHITTTILQTNPSKRLDDRVHTSFGCCVKKKVCFTISTLEF